MTAPTPLYSGECSLLNWGESSRDGRYIRLRIEDEGQHPFKGCTTGAESGQRFMVVFVPINSDNSPAGPVGELKKNGDGKSNLPAGTTPVSSETGPGGKLDTGPVGKPNIHIRRFMALANDTGFWNYLRRVKGLIVQDEAQARVTLKSLCQITSRQELVDGSDAALGLRVIATDFNNWQRGVRTHA